MGTPHEHRRRHADLLQVLGETAASGTFGVIPNVSTERRGGGSLRPAGTIIVTRVRPAAVRIAQATVLFADLRGYTGMAERLPAARILPLLDEFLRTLATATETSGGTVYHMAGDGMMAGFGISDRGGNGAPPAPGGGAATFEG